MLVSAPTHHTTAPQHHAVMSTEVTTALKIIPNGRYIDATFGRGGHSQNILAQLNPLGRLLILDRDPQAIQCAQKLAQHDKRIIVRHTPFAALKEQTDQLHWTGTVAGILFDLGVSSPQLDQKMRGFSFKQDGPLDMRMDPSCGQSAAQWLAKAPEKVIAQVLWLYGQERYYPIIAKKIIALRRHTPLTTTQQLAQLVASIVPKKGLKHPATKTFQAIRIHINQELEQLRLALMQTDTVLAPHGRLVVLSFHSLEDRLVKQWIHGPSQHDKRVNHQLIGGGPTLWQRIKSPKKPTLIETKSNPRARSCILRVAEKRSSQDD
jgi:16S rRNA (cytosine1402-N4)-methyltransferase